MAVTGEERMLAGQKVGNALPAADRGDQNTREGTTDVSNILKEKLSWLMISREGIKRRMSQK